MAMTAAIDGVRDELRTRLRGYTKWLVGHQQEVDELMFVLERLAALRVAARVEDMIQHYAVAEALRQTEAQRFGDTFRCPACGSPAPAGTFPALRFTEHLQACAGYRTMVLTEPAAEAAL